MCAIGLAKGVPSNACCDSGRRLLAVQELPIYARMRAPLFCAAKSLEKERERGDAGTPYVPRDADRGAEVHRCELRWRLVHVRRGAMRGRLSREGNH